MAASILVPIFDICLVDPSRPGRPSGIEVLFPAGDIPPPQSWPPARRSPVLFADSNHANEVMVGFTVDPPAAPADVKFWVSRARARRRSATRRR